MYGSRATNGVVLISTKRGAGTGGAPQFNLTSRVGRSVSYRLLGTRHFTNVGQIFSLPFGNGSAPEDPAFLNVMYPGGPSPLTHHYQSELTNGGKPFHEVRSNFTGRS